MKQKRMIWAMMTLCAFVAAPMLVGCSDDDQPDEFGKIGLSKTESSFVMRDTISTACDGWTLSEVSVIKDKVDEFGHVVLDTATYNPNLTADKPFAYTADWLTVAYDSRKIILSADEPLGAIIMFPHKFKLRLMNGGESVEINGEQIFGISPENAVNASPNSLAFEADGGEEILTVNSGAWIDQMTFDGVDMLSEAISKGKTAVSWLTVECLSDTQWKITAKPNPTSASRTCVIDFELWDYFQNVTVEQAGKAE
jgi:hypothetical protein